MNFYPVFSRKLTRKLEKLGFIVVKMTPNNKYPDKIVYFFEETPELRKAVNELTAK